MNRAQAVGVLFFVLGSGPASAVSLATLISGGQLPPAGNLQFSNFSVGAVSGVAAGQIDVTAAADAGGNAVIRFTTGALSITSNGSNEIIADVSFDASVIGAGLAIRSVTQSFAATVGAGTIAAYDFTSAGAAGNLTAVATACVTGVAGGCGTTTPSDSHVFTGSLTAVRVERQIQLIRTKGSNATGSVAAFDATFAVAGVSTPPPASGPAITAVTRAASYLPGAVSPGLIVTIWGDGMGPDAVSVAAPGADGMFPKALAGTRALFDGVAGAVIFSSRQQVSVVVPYAVYGKSTVQLTLEYNGARSNVYPLDVTDAAPGIFSADASGAGSGAILNVHADGTVALNKADAPAPRGSYIAVYMTGEGQTDPGGTDGLVAGSVLPKPLLKVSAMIGGVPATVVYAGAASSLVAGVMQVNVQAPAGAPVGPAVPIVVQVGDKQSQAGITVAIGN